MKNVKNFLFGLAIGVLFSCSSQAPNLGVPLTPGIYTAVSPSMKGDITVKVTVDTKSITGIEIAGTVDTAQMVEAVREQLLPVIIGNQSTAVDAVSGATLTSGAVLRCVEDALKQAGAVTGSFSKRVVAAKQNKRDEYVDVVVVGGGGAGLSAAIQLTNDTSLKVLLLEKLAYYGGTTGISGGGVWTRDTVYNKNIGVDFSPDQLVDYLHFRCQDNNELNEPLIRNIAGVMPLVFTEYAEKGSSWDTTRYTFGFPNAVPPTFWSKPYLDYPYETGESGTTFVKFLVEQCRKNGVTMRINSPVAELIVDNGVVKGVVVDSEREHYRVYAKKVILACGGFTRNPEMIAEYLPAYVGIMPFCGAGDTGDGFKMTRGLDTVLVGSGMVGSKGYGPNLGYHGPYASLTVRAGLLVNKEGRRFMDESANGNADTKAAGIDAPRSALRAILAQPDHLCYGIFDSASQFMDRINGAVEAGIVIKADTLEELAAKTGLPAASFVASVNAYNAAYQAGNDAEFTSYGSIKPLLQPPFFSIKIAATATSTFTGLKVNENCAVLNSKGGVIPNLYAAGAMIFGNVFTNYYPGSGGAVGTAIYTGAIAANDIKANL